MLQKESESPQGTGHFLTLSVPSQALLEMRTCCLGTALWLQGLHFGCRPSFVIGLAKAASVSAWGWGCQSQLLPLHSGCRLPHQHLAPHPLIGPSFTLSCATIFTVLLLADIMQSRPTLWHTLTPPSPLPFQSQETGGLYEQYHVKLQATEEKKSNKCIPMHSNNAVVWVFFYQAEGDFNSSPINASLSQALHGYGLLHLFSVKVWYLGMDPAGLK